MIIDSGISTGSLEVSGSFSVQGSSSLSQVLINGALTITGSLNVSGSVEGTASLATSASYAETASYVLNAVSSSFAATASYVSNAVSSSFATTASYALQALSSSFATSASSANRAQTASYADTLTVRDNAVVSGSLVILQNLTVFGSASINYVTQSSLDISTNLITVNTDTPGVRFGGLAVADSGSSPRVSGSWLFDSIQDRWTFVHQSISGAPVTSSVGIMGPETYNNLGNETQITLNRLTKGYDGASGEHIGDSQISDDGTTVSIPGNLTVTGSITGLINSASFATTASYALNAGSTVNTGSLVTTSSFNDFTGSIQGQVTSLTAATSSYITAAQTSSMSVLSSSYALTASYALNAGGGDYGATFRQGYTGSTWTVNHNLNTTTPLVNVYSGSAVMIPASIVSTDANNTVITFSGSVQGTAVVSTGVGGPTSSSFALTALTASYALSSPTSTYAVLTKSSPQASFGANTDVNWDSISTNGAITQPSGSGTAFIRVPAGTYRITAKLALNQWSSTTGGLLYIGAVNTSNAVLPLCPESIFMVTTYSSTANSSNDTIEGILVAATPFSFKIRCSGGTGTCQVLSDYSVLIIQSL